MNARFDTLPLLTEGKSKIVRDAGDGLVIVRLKPTIYSYTANRCSEIPGTDAVRLSISAVLWQCLEDSGFSTGVKTVGGNYYLAEKVTAPPIEVIVKGSHIGTPKHIYKGMETFPTRFGTYIKPEDVHEPYVRFDWRNPSPYRDECLPSWLASQFIDVEAAESTALGAFRALRDFLSARKVQLLDICFFLNDEGRIIFGEISPDCMRAKHLGEDLDKDLWRKGGSASDVLRRWRTFHDLLKPSVEG